MNRKIIIILYFIMFGILVDAQNKTYNSITEILYDKKRISTNAETVIENYINAIGGREKISKVNDRTMIMTGAVQGMTLNITIYQKEPDKLLQVVSAGGMEQKLIVNANKGISITPMGKNEITGDMLEELKVDANMNAVLNYSKVSIKTNLVGLEKQNGKDLYKIEMQLPSGKKYFDFYDPETSLKVKQVKSITSPTGQTEQTFEFSDYQDVDGVKYPFKIKQTMGSQNIEVTITSLKVNQNLDDKLFEIEK